MYDITLGRKLKSVKDVMMDIVKDYQKDYPNVKLKLFKRAPVSAANSRELRFTNSYLIGLGVKPINKNSDFSDIDFAEPFEFKSLEEIDEMFEKQMEAAVYMKAEGYFPEADCNSKLGVLMRQKDVPWNRLYNAITKASNGKIQRRIIAAVNLTLNPSAAENLTKDELKSVQLGSLLNYDEEIVVPFKTKVNFVERMLLPVKGAHLLYDIDETYELKSDMSDFDY